MVGEGSTGGADARAERVARAEPFVVGPLILARHHQTSLAAAGPGRGGTASDHEFVALLFPPDRGAARSGDVFVSGGGLPRTTDMSVSITLLAPRRFLAGVLPPGPGLRRLPRSAGLGILQRYLDGLLTLDAERLCERQKALAANAVRSLLAAALPPVQAAEGGLKSRRRNALVDRITTHIDAHLHDDLTVESLCAALGCSRSVLYRATAEAGGAAELILQRRLVAVRERLGDGADRRSIAAIADAYRFPDVVHFNRRFKAQFGASPGAFRGLQDPPTGGARPPSRPRPHGAPRELTRRLPCR